MNAPQTTEEWMNDPARVALVRRTILEVVEREQGERFGAPGALVTTLVRSELGFQRWATPMIEAAFEALHEAGHLACQRDPLSAGVKSWRLTAVGEAALGA
jgi:hypothetical protein